MRIFDNYVRRHITESVELRPKRMDIAEDEVCCSVGVDVDEVACYSETEVGYGCRCIRGAW
jgi:hypothetical protein